MPTTDTMPRLTVRDGNPAVEIKDRTLWARDPRTAEMIAALDEAAVEACYTMAQSTFWEVHVPETAQEHGLAPERVFSDGRSGGWLVVHGTTFLDYVVDDDWTIPKADADADDDTRDEYAQEGIANRDRFLAFARAIGEAMDFAAEDFIHNLSEELSELNERRDAAIIRGEN